MKNDNMKKDWTDLLREKLEKDPNNPEMIKTVWGTGYIFEEE